MLTRIIFVALFGITQAYYSGDYLSGPLTVCEDSAPCSCYPEGWLLECKQELSDMRGKRPRPLTNIQTPSDDFLPLKVDLSWNNLDTFNETSFLTLKQRRTVEVLDLSNNRLGLNEDFTLSSFENLKTLNLSYNRLKATNNNGYNYEYYNGYSNHKNEPHDWLKYLPKTIEVLDLSENQITKTFPFAFLSTFPKLRKLILDGNSLHDLNGDYDKELGSKKSELKELSMNECGLAAFKNGLEFALHNLEKLSLKNNHFNEMPELGDMQKLKFVDLSKNNIQYIYRYRRFSAPVNTVETLLLDNNQIRYINPFDFTKYPNLKKLSLRNNYYFYDFSGNAFGVKYTTDKSRIKLEELDLSGCNIRTLDEELFNWKQLKSLKIRGNPFTCDSSLKWLILDHTLPIEEGNQSATCNYPPALYGQHLHEINEEDIRNPTETAIVYYIRQAMNYLYKNEQLFFFGFGILAACTLTLLLRCCCCLLCCCARRMDNRGTKLQQDTDRLNLLENESGQIKPQQEDTQTIVSTIPDE